MAEPLRITSNPSRTQKASKAPNAGLGMSLRVVPVMARRFQWVRDLQGEESLELKELFSAN